MKDNIKPEHYRTGEIDLFEEWYLTYPFEQYRAIMQSHAEKYLRRNKVNRVEDLDKCVETIRRLKEKEIEYKESQVKSKDEVIDDAIEFMRKHKEEHGHKTPEAAIVDLLATYENGGENGK